MSEPALLCPSCTRQAAVHCHNPDCRWLWCHHCRLVYNAYEVSDFFIQGGQYLVNKAGQLYMERGSG